MRGRSSRESIEEGQDEETTEVKSRRRQKVKKTKVYNIYKR